MAEIKDGLTEEEFKELYWSSTDEERLEISRMLANFVKENREFSEFTDEQIAEREAKLDRYAQVIEDKKRVAELMHRTKTALQMIEDRINARYADMAETESPLFFDDRKDKAH